MKRFLLLLSFALPALAQTSIQKGAGNIISNGNVVVGNSTSITATGSGVIDASQVSRISIVPSAPLTGGGALTGNITIGIPVATGSVNGYLSAADWTTFNAKQPAGAYITALNGDGTATGPGNVTLTLATVLGTPGSVGTATAAPVITFDAKGRATATGTVTITPALGSITGLGTGVATFLATPSSANLRGAVTDGTGVDGSLVFAHSPTLTTPTIAQIVNTGTLTLPTSTDTIVGRATADTLTNKSMSGSGNTFTNIPNSALTNNAVTIGSTTIALGGTASTVTGLATPTQATDAATKQYVDSAIYGLDWKASVRVTTTANITLSGTQTIDSVAVVAGDRVLAKNQTTASQNGIYVVDAGAWSRSSDATTGTLDTGATVFTAEGTANGRCAFSLVTPDPIVVGTTALTFAQVTGPNLYTASTGINITGNLISTVNVPNSALANSTISIAGTSTALGGSISLDTITGLSGTGILARTAANTLTPRTITGTTNQVAVANGDGVSGAPTISLPAAITAPGSLSVTTTLGVTGHTTFEGITSTGATGTGNLVYATSPTLVTPALGTPSAIVLTSGTGLPISTGLTGAGTGVLAALGVNVGTAGAFLVNGGALGTPSSGTLTNATGLPVGGVSGLGTGVATFLATPSSANLAAALTDETGSGSAVFAVTPTLTGSPVVGGATFSGSAATSLNAITAASATALTLSGGATSGNVVINTNGSTLAATFSGANTALAGTLQLPNGSAAAPSTKWAGGATTGLYNYDDGLNAGIGFSIAGVAKMRLSSSALLIDHATASTSTTTGAFQVVGGVGIGGALNVGGSFAAATNFTLSTVSGYNFLGFNSAQNLSTATGIFSATGDATLYLNAPTGSTVRARINGSDQLTVSSTATTLAGNLTVSGNTLTFGGGATLVDDGSGQLTVTTSSTKDLVLTQSGGGITRAGALTLNGALTGITASLTSSSTILTLNTTASGLFGYQAIQRSGSTKARFDLDASDNLVFNVAGSTALTLTTAQNATLVGNLTVSGTGTSSFAGPIRLPSYIMSGLPSASTSGAGAMAYVTDSTATAITGLGLAVVGGGSNKVVVVSDGTNWIVQ